MNSLPFLSENTIVPPSASDIINLLQQGKTLGEISFELGLSWNQISKLCKANQINYRQFNREREERKYYKTFNKCYALALSLNRLPRINETMHISGISIFRSAVIEQLISYGFHHTGKHHIPCPLPPDKLNNEYNNPALSNTAIDKNNILLHLHEIYKNLGGNFTTHQIVSKVSQQNIQPGFDTEPDFFGAIKLRNNRKQIKQKVRRQLLLLKLKSICAEAGFSPDKKQLLKTDPSFCHSLYVEFGGLNYALKEAGLEYRHNNFRKKENHEKLLLRLKSISEDLGFSPGKKELRKIDKSFYLKLYRAFGGLQNALKTIGLPVTRNYRNNNAISKR